MMGSRRFRFAFALAATILFAAAPVVRAYCSVELPAASPATSPTEVRVWSATDHEGAGHCDPCCDASPAAAVDERASSKDATSSAGKLPVLSLILTPGVTVGRPVPASRPTGYHPPPPEPSFLRLPRLLL